MCILGKFRLVYQLEVRHVVVAPPWGQFHQHFYAQLFQSFFCTANCDLQKATSTAKCNLRMAHPAQFSYKKPGETHFQKQAAFCLSCEKAAHKHVDEIDAW
jgi:hypothetical protein